MILDLKVGDLIHIEECSGAAGEERVEVPADLLLVYSDTRSVFLDMSSLTGEKDSVQRKVPLGLDILRPDHDPLYGVLYMNDPKPDLEHFKGKPQIPFQASALFIIHASLQLSSGSERKDMIAITRT